MTDWFQKIWLIKALIVIFALISGLIVGCLPTPTPKPTPTTQSPTSFSYLVQVQAQDTGKDISVAEVTIQVSGKAPLDAITDSKGVARIFVDSSYAGKPGFLVVEAAGYNKYMQNIDVVKGVLPDIVRLEPVPSAITTPSCPAVSGPFAAVWGPIQGELGCATDSAISGFVVEENFEGGKMFWREPIDYAQALVLFNSGTWQIFEHSPYVEGGPEFSCPDVNTPAQCPPTPKRGFGMMWCDIPEIRNGLGNATDCERGYQGSMQQFERGFMLQTDNGVVYIFYSNKRWERR